MIPQFKSVHPFKYGRWHNFNIFPHIKFLMWGNTEKMWGNNVCALCAREDRKD